MAPGNAAKPEGRQKAVCRTITLIAISPGDTDRRAADRVEVFYRRAIVAQRLRVGVHIKAPLGMKQPGGHFDQGEGRA